MMSYPVHLLVRKVNPGTKNEYFIFGPEPSDVADDVVGDGDSLEPKAARYMLVGTGTVHSSSPLYVED
jgi:hypothetical protein